MNLRRFRIRSLLWLVFLSALGLAAAKWLSSAPIPAPVRRARDLEARLRSAVALRVTYVTIPRPGRGEYPDSQSFVIAGREAVGALTKSIRIAQAATPDEPDGAPVGWMRPIGEVRFVFADGRREDAVFLREAELELGAIRSTWRTRSSTTGCSGSAGGSGRRRGGPSGCPQKTTRPGAARRRSPPKSRRSAVGGEENSMNRISPPTAYESHPRPAPHSDAPDRRAGGTLRR